MKSQINGIKRFGFICAIVLSIVSCGKKSEVEIAQAEVALTQEEVVLASSSFFPGELAAPVAAQSQTREAILGKGEGGFIGGGK